MIELIRNFYTASIKRQLIFGIAFVHAVMMTFFVFDLVEKQKSFLVDQHNKKAKSFSKIIASSSISWVLANDFVGLSEVLDSMNEYPGLKYIFITNTQGQILAHTEKKHIGEYVNDPLSLEVLTGVTQTQIVFENEDFTDVSSPIIRDKQLIGWVRIGLSKHNIIEGLEKITFKGILYTLLAILVGVFFAFLMAKGLTKGIYTILDTIENIKNGKKQIRSNLQRIDEIGILSNEFDHLLNVLQESTNEIQQSKEFVKEIINSAPIRIFWKDTNGVYMGANKLFLQDAQLKTEDEIIGKTDLQLTWKSVAHLYLKDDKKIMDTKIAKLRYEEIQVRDNGEKLYLMTSKIPLMDDKNKVYGILGLYDDITQKKLLELKVEEQNQVLEKFNEKLQEEVEQKTKENFRQLQIIQEQSKLAVMGQMIGAIAHNWRQPLNEIAIRIQKLIFDYKQNRINEEFILEFIEKNKKTIQFMSNTIDDFRNLSRSKTEIETFSVKEVIDHYLSIMDTQLRNNNISIEISGDDFSVNGSQSQLQQVLLNVINNAKDQLISKKIQNPWIKIKLEKNIISIEDNAQGIDQNIIDRIFEPYFTTKEQGQGTGLGLYTSKMIIETSFKGHMSVINTPNGAQFFIDFSQSN